MRVVILSIITTACLLYFTNKEQAPPPIPASNHYVSKFECKKRKDCLVLAQAVYYEGRGESVEGQIAIAHVILNRVASRWFPNNVEDVVLQPRQFSYLNGNLLDATDFSSYNNQEAFKQALYVATMVLLGLTDDPTGGATHYLNPKKVKRLPKWARKFEQTMVIGNHTFYHG